MKNDQTLPYTRNAKLNLIVTELMNDWNNLVEKAKIHGMDIRFAPNCKETLELYFHDDYPNMLLVDKSVSCETVDGFAFAPIPRA